MALVYVSVWTEQNSSRTRTRQSSTTNYYLIRCVCVCGVTEWTETWIFNFIHISSYIIQNKLPANFSIRIHQFPPWFTDSRFYQKLYTNFHKHFVFIQHDRWCVSWLLPSQVSVSWECVAATGRRIVSSSCAVSCIRECLDISGHVKRSNEYEWHITIALYHIRGHIIIIIVWITQKTTKHIFMRIFVRVWWRIWAPSNTIHSCGW